jgi:hypothetical protein
MMHRLPPQIVLFAAHETEMAHTSHSTATPTVLDFVLLLIL